MLLFLNDVGGSEILLIIVFILIFFGSKSIPGIAKSMGRTMRQIKDATQEVQNEITKSGMNIRKEMNFKGLVDETVNDIKTPLDQYVDTIDEALKPNSTPYQKANIPSFPPPESEHPEVAKVKEENTNPTTEQ